MERQKEMSESLLNACLRRIIVRVDWANPGELRGHIREVESLLSSVAQEERGKLDTDLLKRYAELCELYKNHEVG